MKFNIYFKSALLIAAAGMATSCNDFLEQEPEYAITPEKYFNDESSLQYYANDMYTILPSHGNWSYGIYGNDNNTDSQASLGWDGKYEVGQWKTGMNNGSWTFTNINTINYFFDQVLPKYEANEIQGEKVNIDRYIGEMYFFRAYQYFSHLKAFGDYPIIEHSLPDEMDVLVEASKRAPRNEVARFILSDLDKAYDLLKNSSAAKTRINADVVLLFKSRVALYEGTWEKNFAGTAFVPGTAEWPGKSYHPDFAFPAGSAEAEYNWFLDQAMAAAKAVGDAKVNSLVKNTGVVPGDVLAEGETDPYAGASLAALEAANPWLAMFGTEDLSANPEVMMWRQYSKSLGVVHNVVVQAQKGNQGVGITRGQVDAFPMANGLPIYASGSGYHGDKTLHEVRLDRDPRLYVLLKEPGQKNVYIENNVGDHAQKVETYPNLLDANGERNYSTGYALRKGNNYDQIHCANGNGYTACPVFRSVEALLNYIEACYERTGQIDATAERYWKAIRGRHEGLETNYMITVNNTNMAEEAKGDWGAYTAGNLIDPLRYNIRRERRLELMAEGFRSDDLYRWRAMDQMVSTGYHIEGMHVWNTPMESWYNADQLKQAVSSKEISEYVRPHESKASSNVKDGLRWTMAHYLQPMPIKQLMLTAPDFTTPEQSVTYQNPYWPTQPNLPATK